MSWVIFDVVDRIKNNSRRQELKLAEAIAQNNTFAVQRLLQQGINPNLKIAGQANEPIIFLVFEKVYFNLPQNLIGDRLLHSYQVKAKEECLRLLLEYGANPDIRNSLGRSPLEIAILWCMPDIVELLILYGADPNLRDRHHLTPLIKAVVLGIEDARPMEDKLQVIRHLIEGGAELDAQAPNGKTALMYGVGNSRIEVVKLLVNSGASLLIEDCEGNRAHEICKGVTPEKRAYLQRILTQIQSNTLKYKHKYKYKRLILEDDRGSDLILSEQGQGFDAN